MKTIFKVGVSLLVGVLAFLAVLVAATELLTPHIWPALIVSVPIALVSGVVGMGFAFLGLRYREERAERGSASPRTVSLLGGFAVGTVTFVLVGSAAVLVLGRFGVPLLTSMLFGGLPAGTLVGAIAGFLVGRRLRLRRRDGGGSEVRTTA